MLTIYIFALFQMQAAITQQNNEINVLKNELISLEGQLKAASVAFPKFNCSCSIRKKPARERRTTRRA